MPKPKQTETCPPLRQWTRKDLENPDNWDFSRLEPRFGKHRLITYDSLEQIFQRELQRELGSRSPSLLPENEVSPASDKVPPPGLEWYATKVRKKYIERFVPVTDQEGVLHRIGSSHEPLTLELSIRLDAGAPRKELLRSFDEMLRSEAFRSLPFGGRRSQGRKRGREHAGAFRDLAVYRHLVAGFNRAEIDGKLAQLSAMSSIRWTHVRAQTEAMIRRYFESIVKNGGWMVFDWK